VDKTSTLKKPQRIFFIAFALAIIASSILLIADLYGFHSPLLSMFFSPVRLLSLPWVYLTLVLDTSIAEVLGRVPIAILRAVIISLGFAINITIIYSVFVRKPWAWKLEVEGRYKLAKRLIYIIAIMKIIIFSFLGLIVPYLGGHGSSFDPAVIPFILAGAGIGCVFAALSVLAARFLEQDTPFKNLYVYGWSVIMILIGLSGLGSLHAGLLALPFIFAGVTGVIVFVTKHQQLKLESSTEA